MVNAVAGAKKTAVSSASSASNSMADREKEIKEACQTMLAAKEKWQKGNDNFFPDWLENAFSAALNVILNGDVPAALVKLHAACVRMADDWALIVSEGEGLDQNGIPGKIFWSKVEAIENLLKVTARQQVRTLPAVEDLWDEFKNDLRRPNHIAKVYGWLDKSGEEPIWRGPFFRDGMVDEAAIKKELKEPGSVVPPGYHPADEEERSTKKIVADSASALARIRSHLKSQGKLSGESVTDPASVEELIRQGQLASVIARVKGISESEVYSIANNLGLRVMTREDIFQNATPAGEAMDDHIYRDAILGTDEIDDVDDDSLSDEYTGNDIVPGRMGSPEDSESDLNDDEDENSESPDDMLARLVEQNPEIDTPGAMKALKAAGVTNLTGQAVGRKLSAIKRASSTPAETVAQSESESGQ